MDATRKIAIIGGGISGITSAIKLAENSNNLIHIYEKRHFILRGPPYCHLHAGGMLYPEISLKDAESLFYDCLKFANKFRNAIHHRPSVISYNIDSQYSPQKLVFKCQMIKLSYIFSKYGKLNTLCNPEHYYAVYQREDIEYYKKYKELPFNEDVARNYHDKYVINFCELLQDIDSIKYPFVSVYEPGIDKDIVEIQLINELHKIKNTTKNIKIITNITVNPENITGYDIIINASGTNLKLSEKILENTIKERYEYKSSWLIKSDIKSINNNFPEIAIIGQRETENGMIQITPLNKKRYQVHCMTSKSTIIDTRYDNNFEKLTESDIQIRGTQAIKKISDFLPAFEYSKVIGECSGIQRIPYYSKNKRISDIHKYQDINTSILYFDIITMKACSVISLCEKYEKLIC